MTKHTNWARLPWLGLAWCSLGLGALGAFLPLIPTTPFLIVAAWAAPKGSPQLARWMYQHPRFGPALHAWRTHGAVSKRAKVTALCLLALSWVLLWFLSTHPAVLVFTALLFISVGCFLLTRPTVNF